MPSTRSPTRTTGKGPLPDPTLLDGSTQQADKKSEQGMIGDFELPGDDNARNGKVGGQQQPQQQGGKQGGGQQGQQGGGQNGMPSAQGGGGAQGQQQGQQAAQNGGAQGGGADSANGAQQQGGGAQGGAQAAGAQAGGQNGTNGINGAAGGEAQGIQVAGLEGDASNAADAAALGSSKPQQVALGDKAMRIPTSGTPAADIVGANIPAGPTQQHEKGTGSGGKGAAGSSQNKGVERGRTMPAGL